ncbi:MAG: hypothetical protein OXF05_02700 [Hyphomicrobiales bacterium]|nr:hypothetical protein [Hyphomicrobiales bacterium]
MDKPDPLIVPSDNQGANPSGGGGDGGGRHSLPERVAILETELKHLATKTWISLIALGIVLSVFGGVWHLSEKITEVKTSFDSYKESHNREHDREDSQ